MSQQHTQWINHRFRGGLATDFGPTVWTQAATGNMDIPYLIEAKNIIYELDGGVHTMPGTTPLNENSLGFTIKGMYDYWRQGATGTATQQVIAHAGPLVLAAQVSDGVFSIIATGFVVDAVPSYETFDDLLIISNDAAADVPQSWDQSTFQPLAGTPPNFSFCKTHKNRVFAAGVKTNPSRLYYSANLDPEDWTTTTSGSIDIDPSDGDEIVGLASFKDELWIFKGPHKGSIHRLSGSSVADFSKSLFIRGITAAYHNSIFTLPNDLGFVSPWGTVHSLVATQSFGDYEQSLLSFPINRGLRSLVNKATHRNWWAVEDSLLGQVLIAYTPSGQTRNTELLMMDYRFPRLGEPFPRWAQWTTYGADALARVIDTNNIANIFVGLDDGFIYKTNQATRQHNADAIIPRVRTPRFTYGSDYLMKDLYTIGAEVRPHNDQAFTLAWTRDGQTQQSTTLTQGGGAILGPTTSNPFTLNSSILGSGAYLTRYNEAEEGGEFRSIDYLLTDNHVGGELEVHGLVAAIQPGGISTENS